MISGLVRRWIASRAIAKQKRELAALYRRYDAICREPGATTAFTADQIGDLGYQIAMAAYRLKKLERAL